MDLRYSNWHCEVLACGVVLTELSFTVHLVGLFCSSVWSANAKITFSARSCWVSQGCNDRHTALLTQDLLRSMCVFFPRAVFCLVGEKETECIVTSHSVPKGRWTWSQNSVGLTGIYHNPQAQGYSAKVFHPHITGMLISTYNLRLNKAGEKKGKNALIVEIYYVFLKDTIALGPYDSCTFFCHVSVCCDHNWVLHLWKWRQTILAGMALCQHEGQKLLIQNKSAQVDKDCFFVVSMNVISTYPSFFFTGCSSASAPSAPRL